MLPVPGNFFAIHKPRFSSHWCPFVVSFSYAGVLKYFNDTHDYFEEIIDLFLDHTKYYR